MSWAHMQHTLVRRPTRTLIEATGADTACEIGMFHALMQSDPSKKGIVGLLTDIRGLRGESTGVNLFVQGAIEDVGRIVASIEEALDMLRAWR